MASVSETAVTIALQEAASGVYETDNDNRGPRIDEYETLANVGIAQPWCAMFVYWCFSHAATQLGVKNPMPAIFGAKQLQLWAKK